jgi:hypothetical protein
MAERARRTANGETLIKYASTGLHVRYGTVPYSTVQSVQYQYGTVSTVSTVRKITYLHAHITRHPFHASVRFYSMPSVSHPLT